MKALVLEQVNSPLAVAEVELGELLHGQVLVKILVSGICGAQLLEIGGHKGNAPFMPHLLGHEACGIVEEIGPGVTKAKKGDKVVMHWRKGDGIEAEFPTYKYNGKAMQSGKVTTFSEYSIVSENRITPVPQNTPNDLCALLGCGLSTALGTVLHEAEVKEGDDVLIVGFGGLGACLVKSAKLAGAKTIVVIDVHEQKREHALFHGAHAFINSVTEQITDVLAKLGIKGFHSIIETSGNPKALSDTLVYLGPSGRYIMVGQPKPGESFEIKNANHLFGGEGKTIRATQGGKFNPSVDIPRYIEMYRSGKLDIDNLVTQRVTLDTVNNAIEMMRSGNANRIMIDISE